MENFKNYLEQLNYSTSAVSQYVKAIESLHAFSGNKPITDVIIESWYAMQQNRESRYGSHLSKSSLNGYINALKAYCKYLRLMKGIYLGFKIKRQGQDENQTIEVLSKEAVNHLYTTLRNQPRPPLKLLALVGIIYGCGLRKSEAGNLDIEDIDLNKDRIYVKKGKGSKSRYVPMSIQVKEDISNYLYAERKHYYINSAERALFINNQGRRQTHFYYQLKQLEALSGLTGLRTHTFRHSIATHLMQEGMNLKQIARFLGHSSLESTQIYTHLAYGKAHV